MKILIVGWNSFIAQHYILANNENEIRYKVCSYLDVTEKLSNLIRFEF